MKTNLQFFKKAALVAASLASLTGIVNATTVSYTYTGETGGGVDIGIKTATTKGTVDVGQFIMTTSNPSYQSTLLTYCTDIGVALKSPYNYTPTPLTSATGVTPTWITGGIQNAATLWYNDKSAATTAIQTAGLQLAIWELLYNSVASSYSQSTFYSTSNKGFYLTTTDANSKAAATYAASVLNSFHTLGVEQNVEWLAPTESNGTIGGSQGLLYQVPGTTSVTAPESTCTLALFGASVVVLGAASRKFVASKI